MALAIVYKWCIVSGWDWEQLKYLTAVTSHILKLLCLLNITLMFN